MVWIKNQRQKREAGGGRRKAKMSVTTVRDVVNIKKWGWRRRVGSGG